MALANKVLATTALAFGMAAANAQSLPFEAGKCHDGPSVEAAMAKDGQKPIFIGKRVDAEGKSPGNVITMNDNGYGYNLERHPDTKQLCVRSNLKNIQLNYVDNPEMPAWGRQIKANNGINVQNAYANGARLVFIAQSYTRNANGQEITGKAVVISAMPSLKGAGVWSVDSNAIPDSSYEMKDFGIVSTNFNYFMGRGFNTRTISSTQNGTVVALKSASPTTP